MIEWVWWWALLLLPAPLLAWSVLPISRKINEIALYVPFFAALHAPLNARQSNTALASLNMWLLIAMWLLLLLSVARPVWLDEPVALPASGRDLMLAVDISGSMEEADFEYNGRRLSRLQAVKSVAGEFIERRQGDRLGLILFGTQAYVQTPLTFDLKTVRHFLEEAVIGLAGQNTSIGDAIGLAVKRLRQHPDGSRTLILLTDGSNTSGLITPQQAAELAQKENIRIYTIGVGADPASGFFSIFGGGSRALDEKSLKAIADATQGRYFRARDIGDLAEIYSLIDELEPTEADEIFYRPLRELFYWPLLALCCLGWILYWRKRGT